MAAGRVGVKNGPKPTDFRYPQPAGSLERWPADMIWIWIWARIHIKTNKRKWENAGSAK